MVFEPAGRGRRILSEASGAPGVRIQRRTLVFPLVLLILASCQSGGTFRLSHFLGLNEPIPETVTLLSWNAQKAHDPRAADDLTALIEQHDPDLVFLQEARAKPFSNERMVGHFANSWSYPWPGGATVGVLTLSKSSPVRVQPLQTKWREFLVTAPKVSLLTEHPLPNGETLLAVNVHLLNFESSDNPFMLRSQLDDLQAVMARHSGPLILAGDFNTWNEARLGLVEDMVAALGLREVTDFPEGRKTGNLDSQFLHWLFGVDTELPLDRVYTRGFAALSAEVLPTESSDHRPILVTLDLNPDWRRRETPAIAACGEPPLFANLGATERPVQAC